MVGAKNWYRFLINEVGFQGSDDGLLAINYFANVAGGLVPNNTTLTLLTLAKLANATNDGQYLTSCEDVVAWLSQVQLETGELPYADGSAERRGRCHFLCYQYNAFEFIDLVRYHRIAAVKRCGRSFKDLRLTFPEESPNQVRLDMTVTARDLRCLTIRRP